MDIKLFQALNTLSRRSSLLNSVMILVSKWMRYVFILLLLILFFKNHGYKRIAWNATFSAFATLIINAFIKLVYFKPRPFIKRRVGILIPSKIDSSFPSKHALLVFAASTSVFLYKKTLGIMMFGLSLLTGLSRVWVGHHYPSDIIGSAFIGSLTSIVVHKLPRFNKET